MTKQTTLARIERLMHVPGNKYFIRATEALQAGRITSRQYNLFMDHVRAGYPIPTPDFNGTHDDELRVILRTLLIWPPVFTEPDQPTEYGRESGPLFPFTYSV
jgi:hypothetical protein